MPVFKDIPFEIGLVEIGEAIESLFPPINFIEDIDIIKSRRNGTYLFYNKIDKVFIRGGEFQEIQKEYLKHKVFESVSSKLSDLKKIGEIGIYTETKIGEDTFGSIIRGRYGQGNTGVDKRIVTPAQFEVIFNLLTKFFTLQKELLHPIDPLKITPEELNENLCINRFEKEVDELEKEDDKKVLKPFLQELKKIVKDNKNNLLLGATHGDLNLFNFLENGIIDFEDSQYSFIGIDLVNFLMHNLMCGKGNLLRIAYVFSDEQMDRVIEFYNNLHGTDIRDSIGLLILLRLPWWLCGLQDAPDFRNLRIQMAKDLLIAYSENKLNLEYIREINKEATEFIMELNKKEEI